MFTVRSVVRIHPWEPFLCCFEQLRPAPGYLVSPNPFTLRGRIASSARRRLTRLRTARTCRASKQGSKQNASAKAAFAAADFRQAFGMFFGLKIAAARDGRQIDRPENRGDSEMNACSPCPRGRTICERNLRGRRLRPHGIGECVSGF